MVLIVVLAVMAGFEREVKSRLLGFSPHVELQMMGVEGPELIYEWREITERVEKIEGVEEAYAQLRDFTILEMSDLFYPVEYRAIDTSNERQMASLEGLIMKKKYGGTADMGLDEKAVVAESTAVQFGIRVGDKILLHSARNLQQMAKAWKITDRPLIAEEFVEEIGQIRQDLRTKMTVEATQEGFDLNCYPGSTIRLTAFARRRSATRNARSSTRFWSSSRAERRTMRGIDTYSLPGRSNRSSTSSTSST